MEHNQIAQMFRQSELQRREARRKIMLNEAALINEPLTDAEKIIDANAKIAIQRQQLEYEKAVTPGYWKRLWWAILGR